MATTEQTKTYELCFSPRENTVLLYRSITAGIRGPCSDTMTCESQEQAERIAFDMGFLIASDWQSHTNYDSAPLTRMAR